MLFAMACATTVRGALQTLARVRLIRQVPSSRAVDLTRRSTMPTHEPRSTASTGALRSRLHPSYLVPDLESLRALGAVLSRL